MSIDGIRAVDKEPLAAVDALFGMSSVGGQRMGPRPIAMESVTQQIVASLPLGNVKAYASVAAMNADTAPASGTLAYAEGKTYRKTAASGSAGWAVFLDYIPGTQIVRALITGGTANGVIATSETPVSSLPYLQLITIGPFSAPNTGAMTITINGETPLPLVLNRAGAMAIPPGYIQKDISVLAQRDSAGNYRLFSYGDASAIQAVVESLLVQAQAAAASAADYAALARNDFVVNRFAGDGTTKAFTLSADPGSGSNCLIYIDGVYQQKDTYSLSGTTITFSEAPPRPLILGFENVEICFGFRVAVGTPADGSITGPKIGAAAVTTTKVADGNITNIKIADLNVTTAKLADSSVTTSKIADSGVSKSKVADDAVDETKLDSNRKPQIRAELECSFSANKNATDQTGILPTTFTKVTFLNEEWDIGGYYDAANGKFTPPAGRFQLKVVLYYLATAIVDGQEYCAGIYKNGIIHRWASVRASAATQTICVQFDEIVDANGSDYFEAYAWAGGAGNKSISGDKLNTYFQGRAV